MVIFNLIKRGPEVLSVSRIRLKLWNSFLDVEISRNAAILVSNVQKN